MELLALVAVCFSSISSAEDNNLLILLDMGENNHITTSWSATPSMVEWSLCYAGKTSLQATSHSLDGSAYKLIPEDFSSKRNRITNDGSLAETLFYHIARQIQLPAASVSVHGSNCYDRIAHAIASLMFQSITIHPSVVKSVLEAIP